MLRGIFIDLNVLLEMDNQAWVVDKKNANTPIVKISKSDFNLIKSGIFKNQGNKVDFNGRTYYLPTELMNKIKIKTKSKIKQKKGTFRYPLFYLRAFHFLFLTQNTLHADCHFLCWIHAICCIFLLV
jgi:hypothetical protein